MLDKTRSFVYNNNCKRRKREKLVKNRTMDHEKRYTHWAVLHLGSVLSYFWRWVCWYARAAQWGPYVWSSTKKRREKKALNEIKRVSDAWTELTWWPVTRPLRGQTSSDWVISISGQFEESSERETGWKVKAKGTVRLVTDVHIKEGGFHELRGIKVQKSASRRWNKRKISQVQRKKEVGKDTLLIKWLCNACINKRRK